MNAPALWTAEEAGAATGGRNSASWRARGVCIDSRTIASEDLFVAIEGPTHDGHDFLAAAFDGGAAAGLVARTPSTLPAGAPVLVVDDTMDALNALARASRARSRARIAAITGSAGKTGTKEALRHVLARQAPTAASESSLNNHWGVPLSLARMPAAAAYGVFEVGMNHAGEISPLSRLLRPHVAVVTTVEAAHIEFFDSVEAIADAKAEIFDGIEAGGVAVLNRDNPHYHRLARAAAERGIEAIVGFGAHDEAEARLVDCDLEPESSRVTAIVAGTRLDYRIGVPGRHWVMNSLAVLAAAGALGADVEAAAAALAEIEPLAGRGRIHRLTAGAAGITLIDDSYNANPASVRAAIEQLARMVPGAGGRRIAVLGTMLELGPAAPALHAALAVPLAEHGIDLVFTAGEMRALGEALPAAMRGANAETGAELAPAVAAAVRAGDVVMVKGSNASRMGVVVDTLLQRG